MRKLALAAQGLDNSWKLPKGKEAAALAVERLGHLKHDAVLEPLARKLRAFAAFNGCEEIVIDDCEPKRMKAPFQKLVE